MDMFLRNDDSLSWTGPDDLEDEHDYDCVPEEFAKFEFGPAKFPGSPPTAAHFERHKPIKEASPGVLRLDARLETSRPPNSNNPWLTRELDREGRAMRIVHHHGWTVVNISRIFTIDPRTIQSAVENKFVQHSRLSKRRPTLTPALTPTIREFERLISVNPQNNTEDDLVLDDPEEDYSWLGDDLKENFPPIQGQIGDDNSTSNGQDGTGTKRRATDEAQAEGRFQSGIYFSLSLRTLHIHNLFAQPLDCKGGSQCGSGWNTKAFGFIEDVVVSRNAGSRRATPPPLVDGFMLDRLPAAVEAGKDTVKGAIDEQKKTYNHLEVSARVRFGAIAEDGEGETLHFGLHLVIVELAANTRCSAPLATGARQMLGRKINIDADSEVLIVPSDTTDVVRRHTTYCTTLYGSNGHGNGSPVALLVFGGVTVTMKAVALKKS
ncbi:hypothetical protein C8F04DRAFT_1230462 [Mycena alexandri]|uniref:Uncharacterized protein n=1 Tax=Mycena alexandri TaxID=1745969 RepID=A0AAD6X9B4_9AGAR|nr:hypothetical protein C8F04DRAFT_1230462 [Mycena alexandri]